jgi:methionyl-tRNA formyltransferase
MKIVFFGTPDFACDSLRTVAAKHDVVACVTRPDRRAGRGRKLTPSPVSELCEKLGIETFKPESRPQVANVVCSLKADAFVVVAYGVILPGHVLEMPKLGCFNLHGSLLPKYRGAAPINWTIVRGETKTGVTVIRMTERMDAGPILGTAATDIGHDETAGELFARLAKLGAEILASTLDAIEAGTAAETPQNEDDVTLAPTLTKNDGRVDWDGTPDELRNFVRGMTPWPGAHTLLPTEKGNVMLAILEVEAAEVGDITHFREAKDGIVSPSSPGTILSASDAGIQIACREGSVLLTRIKPAGKREMTAAEFLRGHTLPYLS